MFRNTNPRLYLQTSNWLLRRALEQNEAPVPMLTLLADLEFDDEKAIFTAKYSTIGGRPVMKSFKMTSFLLTIPKRGSALT